MDEPELHSCLHCAFSIGNDTQTILSGVWEGLNLGKQTSEEDQSKCDQVTSNKQILACCYCSMWQAAFSSIWCILEHQIVKIMFQVLLCTRVFSNTVDAIVKLLFPVFAFHRLVNYYKSSISLSIKNLFNSVKMLYYKSHFSKMLS